MTDDIVGTRPVASKITPELTLNDLVITQDNLYLLLPGKISHMAVRYAKEYKVSLVEAVKYIYQSDTYKQLAKEETKLWHLGPVALYEYLIENK